MIQMIKAALAAGDMEKCASVGQIIANDLLHFAACDLGIDGDRRAQRSYALANRDSPLAEVYWAELACRKGLVTLELVQMLTQRLQAVFDRRAVEDAVEAAEWTARKPARDAEAAAYEAELHAEWAARQAAWTSPPATTADVLEAFSAATTVTVDSVRTVVSAPFARTVVTYRMRAEAEKAMAEGFVSAPPGMDQGQWQGGPGESRRYFTAPNHNELWVRPHLLAAYYRTREGV